MCNGASMEGALYLTISTIVYIICYITLRGDQMQCSAKSHSPPWGNLASQTQLFTPWQQPWQLSYRDLAVNIIITIIIIFIIPAKTAALEPRRCHRPCRHHRHHHHHHHQHHNQVQSNFAEMARYRIFKLWSRLAMATSMQGVRPKEYNNWGAGWQKLRGSTGGTRRKVWTRTKILSPNIRYFVAN